ncbi:MAG: hypothetical protein WAW17_13585 [Rhodococcus sp. (in: high G+C Gram-positive bacteria)]|uniref:hypothetical protein n=1 Tax=Rhodococcus sp. TaxID=1831 RepID=UPI003BAF6DD2
MTTPTPTQDQDPAGLAVVGRVWANDQFTWYPMSAEAMARAEAGAEDYLRRLGLRSGQVICFVSRHAEVVQFAPLERAALRLGLVTCHVEANAFDANRLAVYLEHLQVAALIGLTGEVLGGLDAEITSLLKPDTTVVSRGTATEQLRDQGVRPLHMVVVGPALALECSARSGLHLDGSAWSVRMVDGLAVVTGRHPDGTDAQTVVTDLRGSIITDECDCGSNDPRFVPAT